MAGSKPASKKGSPQESEAEQSGDELVSITAAAKKAKRSRSRQASPEKPSRRNSKQSTSHSKRKSKGKRQQSDSESDVTDSDLNQSDLNSVSRQVNDIHGRIVGPSRGKSKFDKLINNVVEVNGRLDAIERALKKLAVSVSQLSTKVDEYGETNKVTHGKKVKGRSGSKHDTYSSEEESSEEESERDDRGKKVFSIPSYGKSGKKNRRRDEDYSD